MANLSSSKIATMDSGNKNSILANKINSFMPELTALCQRYLEFTPKSDIRTPSGENNFKNFLNTYFFEDDAYERFVSGCGIFGASTPVQSYQIFENILPKIDLNSSKEPQSTDNTIIYFTDRLSNVNWGSETQKTAIYFFIESTFSGFLTEMLQRVKELSNEDVTFFITNILGFLNSSFNQLNCGVLNKIAESRMEPLYYLSKFNSDLALKLFLKIYEETMNEAQKIALYTTFSSIVIESSCLQLITTQIKSITQELQSSKGDLHEAIGSFLYNLSIQLFKATPSCFTSHVFSSLIYSAKEESRTIASSILTAFFAAISSDIQDKPLKTVDEYFAQEVENRPISSPDDVEKCCRGLTVKLYGDNYLPKVELMNTHANINWTPSFDDKNAFYKKVGNWISSNTSHFINADEYASKMFEQLCFIDPQLFIKEIYPILVNSTYFEKPLLPLIKGMYMVLSNAEETSQESRFTELKSSLVKLVADDIALLKIDINQVISLFNVNSFTAGFSAAIDEPSIALRKMCRTLIKTSFPLQAESDKSSSTNMKIGKIICSFDKYEPINFKKDEKQIKTQTSETENTIIPVQEYILMLSLYLDPDSEMAEFLCYMLFSESLFTNSLAIRVYQAMIHKNKRFAELAVRQLCNFFIHQNLSFIGIITVVSALMHVLEAANTENVQFTNSTMNAINYVVIIGLCVPSPSIRNHIFEMCHIMNKSKTVNFYFQQFFDKKHDEISQRAQSNAIDLVAIISEAERKTMEFAKFTDVANSDYSSFYIFYIASLGHHLAREAKNISKDFEESLFFTHKILINLLLSSISSKRSSDDYNTAFLYNCAAMLISISDINRNAGTSFAYFNMQRIQSICRKLIEKLIKSNDKVLLAGIFSSCGSELLMHIIPILAEPVLSIQQTLVFCLRGALKRKEIHIIDENGKVRMPIYTALQSTLITTVRANIIGSKCKYEALMSTEDSKQFAIFMELFAQTLKITFDDIFETFQEKEKISALVATISSEHAYKNMFDNSIWFTFFCNITAYDGAPFINSMLDAFASWLKIAKVPEEYFDEFAKHIFSYSNKSINIPISFFSQNPEKLINIYIEGARSNYQMFAGIAAQIDGPQNVIEHLDDFMKYAKERKNTYVNSPIIDIYYENIGQLIAVCFTYLVSQAANEREGAIDFLEKLILLSSIKRNDTLNACIMLKALSNARPVLFTSFSVFIQRDIYMLASLLSNYMGFCSEQFISQCFAIAATRTKMGTTKLSRRKSSLRLQEVDQQRERRRSTIEDRISILGIKQNEALKKLNSALQRKFDNFDVNTEEIILNLIPYWLKPFSYDFNKKGICTKCEEHFKCYGIYTFIEELLNTCSLVGMVQALSIILDAIIDKDPEYFIFSLISMQARSDDSKFKDSAQQFLIYLFNKLPEVFVKNILKYLHVPSWYFYNIQSHIIDSSPEQDKAFDDVYGDEYNYTAVMMFVIDLIEECYKENSEMLEPIKQYIIAFCDIMTSDALSNDEEFPMIDEDLANKMNELIELFIHIKDKKNSIAALSPFYKQCDLSFIMEWSFCCGWLPAATRALTMFNYNGNILKKEEFGIVLRSMQCIAAVLNERTDPAKNSLFNKEWLKQVTIGKNRIDVKPAINYLTASFVCVENYLKANKEEECNNSMIFSMALQFMNCHSADYAQIFAHAVSLISFFIKNSTKLEETAKVNKEGILSYFFKCSDLNPRVLEELHSIVLECVTKKLFSLLAPSEYTSLYILVPFMWGQQCSEEICNKVASAYSPANKDLIYKAISDKIRQKSTLVNFNEKIIRILRSTNNHIDEILHIYAQIAKYGKQDQQEAVFCITGVLMKYIANKQEQKDLAVIADLAIKNQTSNNEAILNFIRELVVSKIMISPCSTSTASKIVSLFPRLNIYSEEKIFNWEPHSENAFEAPAYYPPMYVADEKFNGAEFLAKERNAISKIHEVTFTKLDEKFIASEKESRKQENKEKLEHVKCNIIEFIQKLNESASKVSLLQSTAKMSATANDIKQITTVTPNVFYPSHADIQSLGESEMQNLEIPFLLH